MSDKPQHGAFCWNELMTNDSKAAKDFYGKLFGWKYDDQKMKDMTYTMLNMGDKMVGGMFEMSSDQKSKIPPHWMGYIAVDNLEETVKKAQELGAKVVVEPKNAGEYGRLAVLTDPTGAHIAFWQAMM